MFFGYMLVKSQIHYSKLRAWLQTAAAFPPRGSTQLDSELPRQGFEMNFHNLQHLLEHSESLSPSDAQLGCC